MEPKPQAQLAAVTVLLLACISGHFVAKLLYVCLWPFIQLCPAYVETGCLSWHCTQFCRSWIVYQGSGVDSNEWESVSQEIHAMMQVGNLPCK